MRVGSRPRGARGYAAALRGVRRGDPAEEIVQPATRVVVREQRRIQWNRVASLLAGTTGPCWTRLFDASPAARVIARDVLASPPPRHPGLPSRWKGVRVRSPGGVR